MPVFDVNKFVQQTSTAKGSTEYLIVPEGEYKMILPDEDPTKWLEQQVVKKEGPRQGSTFLSYEIPTIILDDAVRAAMGGRDEVRSRIRGIIDINEQTGDIDWGKGKNVKLGQLREALGQNDASKPWNFLQLKGAGPFKGIISHRPGRGNSAEQMFAEVTRTTKL